MASPGDVAVLISNSGRTAEVCQFGRMLARGGIPVLAMTGVDDSPLARLATVHLSIAVDREADPLGLAPTASTTVTVAIGDALAAGKLQILCLGDGFHAEARAAERWSRAYEEYIGGYRERRAMDEEMRESLSLMEMVMACKIAYPERFHFLKGNHENVLDEEGGGNHSFGKFAEEGAMVAEYMERFYGPELTAGYAAFENALPLFAAGGRFLASHAEPARAFSEEELIDAPNRPEVILGLTWTDNGAADPGAVPGLLDRFLPGDPDARYFTGHRPVPMRKRYRERSGGRHLQIHAPDSYNVAWVMPDRPFDKDLDIGAIRDLSSGFNY